MKKNEIIFDRDSREIRELISTRNWEKLTERNKIMCIYDFVKNEIPFGFTPKACQPASQVLLAGKATALNKCILLKTLLDACGSLCRWHALKVKKELYRGLIRSSLMGLFPDEFISVWVEIFFEGQWLVADGVLLDSAYLNGLKGQIAPETSEFIGYGAGIFLSGNHIDTWNGKQHSYCQRAAIIRDLGVLENIDWFFEEYRKDIRKLSFIPTSYANKFIQRIRAGN